MLDRPFTDVCCTVSCWALLFSVIIPTMQAMGVEATAFSHWDSRQHHHQQQQQHLHLQQFHHLNHRQQQHSLMKPQTFALTVYLESNPQGLFALPILANPSGTPSPQNQGQEDQHHLQCQHLQSHHPFKVYANNGRSTTDQSTRTKRPALPAAQIQRNGCRRNVRTVIVSKKCSDPISHLQLNAGKRATVHGHCGPLKLSRHQYPQALLQGLDRALPSTSISTSTSSSVSTSSPGSPMVQEDKQNVQRAIDESVNDDNTIYSTMRSLAMAAGMQLPKYSDDLSPQTSIPPASLFAAWTKNDLGFARALWDYWQELDALNRIQMELEEQLSNELDHVMFSSPSIQCSNSPLSKKSTTTLWKGRVSTATAWGSRESGSLVSTRLQDDISGPIMHFPLSAPMPAMPHQWVALMPCALKSAVDHAALQSDASAIIVYPTMRANCSRTPALKDSPVPLMILDYESSKQLILTLDNLSHGTRAMATLSTATLGIDSTRTKSVGTDMEVDNEEKAQDAHEISQEGFGDSLHTEGHGQPEQRQVVLSLPETASMVDSFKSRAVLQARRILVSLGLGTRYTEFNESLSARPDSFGKENSGLAQPVHPAQTSQILDEIQSLVLLEDSRHANSLSTQLATVFMSTICGVGIGMFGALLFVVVLKLRLAQMSRRSGRSGGQGRLTAAQQLQVAHQQIMRDTCCRRLLPKTVLEGYAVHTVLHTSPSMVKLSAPATTEKPRSGMAWLFSKPEQNCMEDVVGTEGFQGGLEAKETARRQRLRLRRRSRTANECDYESEDEEEEEDVEGDDEDEVNDDEDVTSENEADEEAHTDSAVDMDQATAAITTATSQDSYHRVTYNRQGHLNPPSPSSSSSSSSESFSSKGRCSTQKKKKQGELPFANANAQTMCAVCLTDYEVGDKVRILPCFHQYHQECIDPWLLDVVSLCPICKVDLRHTSSSPK